MAGICPLDQFLCLSDVHRRWPLDIAQICYIGAGVLSLLLRVQADQKPLLVVISGVIARHVRASAAGSPQDDPQSPTKQHSHATPALQCTSGLSSAKQPTEQARPSKRRPSGVDSASAAQAAAQRLDGHIVTMQTSGTDEDRDAAVPRKRSKREPNHVMEGHGTLRQGSEAAMEILQRLGGRAASGTAAYGHDYRHREESCLQHFIGSIPGATGDQTHLMIVLPATTNPSHAVQSTHSRLLNMHSGACVVFICLLAQRCGRKQRGAQ